MSPRCPEDNDITIRDRCKSGVGTGLADGEPEVGRSDRRVSGGQQAKPFRVYLHHRSGAASVCTV